DDLQATVTMRSRTPGRARSSVNTIARGRPDVSVEPVVTNSCAFLLHTRLRVRSAPGLPRALSEFRGWSSTSLGHVAPRECGLTSPRRHCERSEAIQNLSAATLWIASSLALLAMTKWLFDR